MKTLLILLIFFTLPLQARWMNKKNASMKVEAKSHFKVNKDLTYKMTYDLVYHISTEEAKESLSIFDLSFVPDRQRFHLESAEIIHPNGKKATVDRSKIEYKDRSGAARGFSSIKQVRIPLKQLQVGSRFHIVYSIEVFELQVENQFSLRYKFLANGMHFLKESLELESEVPLYFNSRDQNNWVRVQGNGKTKWRLNLKRDRALYLIDEFDVINSEKHNPSFVFSNFKNWSDFKETYLSQIQPRFDEKLPRDLNKIIRKVKRQPTPLEKVSATLSYIIENYTYLGDWRPVKGGHIPRRVSEIVESKYGDCKDFSLLATRILNEADLQVFPALILRGYAPPYKDELLSTPQLTAFNHMIIAVKGLDGIEFYDPTNTTVIVRSIPLDLADRYALLLDPESEGFVFTPAIDPEYNQLHMEIVAQSMNKKSGLIEAKAKYKINGPEAHSLLARNLTRPLPVAQLQLRDRIFYGERVKKHKVLRFPKRQRVLPEEGLEAQYRVWYSGPLVETTEGLGVVDTRSVGFPSLPSSEDIKDDRVNDLYLKFPIKSTRLLRFPIDRLNGKTPEECLVDNPYFKRQRKFAQNKKYVERFDELVIKLHTVPIESLKTKKFIADLEKAKSCNEPVVLVTGQ